MSKFTAVSSMQPKMFQLTVNYRSHAGIVNCAHSVVSLITRFWPDAIDILAPERGVVDGAKPVFLARNEDEEAGDFEQFLFGDDENPLEFGAQQCMSPNDSLKNPTALNVLLRYNRSRRGSQGKVACRSWRRPWTHHV